MDAYRTGNKIALWIKTKDQDIRTERDFCSTIYVALEGIDYLLANNIPFQIVTKKTFLEKKQVLEVKIPHLSMFEQFIKKIEYGTLHRVPLYNADIKPEQMFLYQHDLFPCWPVDMRSGMITKCLEDHPIRLTEMHLSIEGNPISKIMVNNTELQGLELDMLSQFVRTFRQSDPDVIIMERGYANLPILDERIRHYGLTCSFHRWDSYPLKSRGGRSYWSYNTVRYQDYGFRLRGRFLVDTSTFLGSECIVDAIIELSQLSGTLFQQTASRSPGAAFQTRLVREMIMQGNIVPFKEKPIEPPISMLDMLTCDRGGHYHDPLTGFHTNVAELDFASMFPWLIYNHNISAETILCNDADKIAIPNTPFRVSMRKKGIIPLALKPFIDRRMYYKHHPSSINKHKAAGLKWLLVSCYGYLRFREFKAGIPSSHMCICSLARETILRTIHLAEKHGFTVVHSIVDSIYITKKNMKQAEVEKFRQEIEQEIGIPLFFEGIFKWIVFLPSVVDSERQLPATYYGVFKNGDIKTRGIEVRQRSVPKIVKLFQTECILYLRSCDSKQDVVATVPSLCKKLHKLIQKLPQIEKELLVTNIKISRGSYINATPQKIITEKLRRQGHTVVPGMMIRFIHSTTGPVIPDEFGGNVDITYYKKLLIRSLFIIVQPFGYTKEMISELCQAHTQTTLPQYVSTFTTLTYKPTQMKMLIYP